MGRSPINGDPGGWPNKPSFSPFNQQTVYWRNRELIILTYMRTQPCDVWPVWHMTIVGYRMFNIRWSDYLSNCIIICVQKPWLSENLGEAGGSSSSRTRLKLWENVGKNKVNFSEQNDILFCCLGYINSQRAPTWFQLFHQACKSNSLACEKLVSTREYARIPMSQFHSFFGWAEFELGVPWDLVEFFNKDQMEFNLFRGKRVWHLIWTNWTNWIFYFHIKMIISQIGWWEGSNLLWSEMPLLGVNCSTKFACDLRLASTPLSGVGLTVELPTPRLELCWMT